MEFEENTPTSDADRRLAEAKKLTLQPIHANVSPEDPHDNEIAVHHLIEPAIANISNDTEEYSSFMPQAARALDRQPANAKFQPYKLILGIIASISLFTGLTIIAFLK
jgi:hypothetical protein